jgi:hypothetical protein
MKKIKTIIPVFFILLFIISCTKSAVKSANLVDTENFSENGGPGGTIVGNWNLVSDSSYLEGTPIFQGGGSVYTGVATDYFVFTPGDSLYIKMGSELDTATYSLPSGDQVTFDYYTWNGHIFPDGGISGPYNITVLTDHLMTLTLTGITPAGNEFAVINLKR